MEQSFFDVVDSEFNSSKIVESVCKKLEDKYNEEFLVTKIGNRYGMNSFEKATLYCTTKDNTNLLFLIEYDMVKEEILEDNYSVRKICFELENIIEKEFKLKNLEIINRVEILNLGSTIKNCSVFEFLEKNKNIVFLDTIVIKNEISEEALKKVFETINQKVFGVNLKTLIYIMNDNDFLDYSSKVKEFLSLSITDIEKYDIQGLKKIKIVDGNVLVIE